jgi:hypothetical protein
MKKNHVFENPLEKFTSNGCVKNKKYEEKKIKPKSRNDNSRPDFSIFTFWCKKVE